MFRRIWSALAAVCALAQPAPEPTEVERELKRFAEVFSIVEREAAEFADFDQLFYRGAIPGLLRPLDPHSVFFDRDQFEQLKEMQNSVSKGFGSVVSVLPGRVIVLQTQPGSPSARAGLAPGDEILAVNHIPLAGLSLEQLTGLLGASRQREAVVTIRRPGSARLLDFTMVPAEQQTASVDRLITLAPGAAYLRVSSFDQDTGARLREAIEKLGGANLESLVLDLRENPGGVLGAALESASLFLDPGKRLLTARGRTAQTQEIDVPQDAQPYRFRLAVLLNAKSASGSEIVAGALQDHDRAIVLGEPSFGKGLVQSVLPLSQGTGLALTTAFYYTPSGRSIQRPLRAGQLIETTTSIERPVHKTATGRTVRGGGGIEPDILAYPPVPSRLLFVMEASASFTTFAGEYLRKTPRVPVNFTVPPVLLDEFQVFLANRRIQPNMADWSADRETIQSRLQQEILTLAHGVAAGDEVEVRRDPVVRRAQQLMSSSASPRAKSAPPGSTGAGR
jgi:carboxyl-terminal processing protease